MNRKRQLPPDTTLSKSLSWLLRHGAIGEGLIISSDGFIDLDVILSHRNFVRIKCLPEDIFRVVQNDKKNRYTLEKCSSTGKWRIKANQGHSLSEVNNLNLQKVSCPEQIPLVVHGTFARNWATIKSEGIKRMNRNHIHFAMSDVQGGSIDESPISGLRNNCEVLIYLDASSAMKKGVEFFISKNKVILSPGLDGVIKPEFFLKVVDWKTGKLLEF